MSNHYIMGLVVNNGNSYQYLIPNVDGGILYADSEKKSAFFDKDIFLKLQSIGKEVRSFIDKHNSIKITTSTNTDITYIDLESGIWDISAIGVLSGHLVGTSFSIAISSKSQTMGNEGDNQVSTSILPSKETDISLTIPFYRVVVSEITRFYLVIKSIYVLNGAYGYGRISAVRMG